MEQGGVYVLANIRGGGEFGPKWHKAAQGHAHMKNFEDFIAVAEDLQARKITDKDHLGIYGGSQGGLLVGGAFALRPDLFKAVVSAVPLADMKRYHKLLAGASWMAEYGNPDIAEDWAVIKTWSPYELLKKDKPTLKISLRTTAGVIYTNISELTAASGGTLLFVKNISQQGSKYTVLPVEEVAEINYSSN